MGVSEGREQVNFDIIVEHMEGGEMPAAVVDEVLDLGAELEVGTEGKGGAVTTTTGGLMNAAYRWVLGDIKSKFVANTAEIEGDGSEKLDMARSGLDYDVSKFRFGHMLGGGQFGEVCLVEHKLSGDQFALKTLKAVRSFPSTNVVVKWESGGDARGLSCFFF